MIKRNFLVNFITIQLVFGVKLLRIDVNHGPARRDLLSNNKGTSKEKFSPAAGFPRLSLSLVCLITGILNLYRHC